MISVNWHHLFGTVVCTSRWHVSRRFLVSFTFNVCWSSLSITPLLFVRNPYVWDFNTISCRPQNGLNVTTAKKHCACKRLIELVKLVLLLKKKRTRVVLRNKRFVYYSARTKSLIYCQTVHHIDWCHYSFSIARSSDEANPLQYHTLQMKWFISSFMNYLLLFEQKWYAGNT